MSIAEVLNPRALIPCKRLLVEALERTIHKEREREYAGERERERESKTHYFSKLYEYSVLCIYNALISAIYTSPHGTVRSTVYFNAHTSI